MSQSATYLGRPVEEWTKALHGEDPLLRRLASHALGEIGPGAAQTIPVLAVALRDPVAYVRVWAAAALARVAPHHPEAIAVLIAATADEQNFVRILAAWHLGRLGQEHPGIDAAVPELQALLDDRDGSVRAEATLALRHIFGKAGPPRELKGMPRVPPGLVQ